MPPTLTESKTDFVPPVYYIASLKSGRSVFQDVIPNEVSSWRRLRDHLKESGDFITKLRIQTPHKLIDCPGNNYKYLCYIIKVRKAFHELDRQDLNGQSFEYATMNPEDGLFNVCTVFEPDNFVHVGAHRAYLDVELPEGANELDRKQAISINSIGLIVNTPT